MNASSPTAGPEEIAQAVARLRAGGVVAFPTETVYGLGADAFSEPAVRRVFALKGRPANNPLIVHVSGEEMARRAAAPGAWSRQAAALARAFWPGPLTIVVPRSPDLPPIVTAGGPTVAVRAPDHHVTLGLLEAFGGPLVGPSANPSGRVSPTTASHVRASFSAEDVFVLDGGPCRAGIESTVLILEPAPRILRPGPVSADEIAAVIGRPVEPARPGAAADPGIAQPAPPAPDAASAGSSVPKPGARMSKTASASETAKSRSGSDPAPALSPGLQARHYAPRTPTRLIAPGAAPALLDAITRQGRVALLAISPADLPPPHALIPMPAEPRAYAARLYAALREADEIGVALIAIERPAAPGPLWDAIRDRLSRAATA